MSRRAREWGAILALGWALAHANSALAQEGHAAPATHLPAAGHEAEKGEDEHQSVVPPWGRALEAEHGPSEHLEEEEHHFVPRIWVRTEYLFSWVKSESLPTLVTSGLTTDVTPGAIGLPFSDVLYGDSPINYQDRAGMRVSVGVNLDEEGVFAVEGSYLTLGGRIQALSITSPGTPVIARPFFNVLSNQQDSSLVTYPGLAMGEIGIQNTSYLNGFEANGFFELCKGERGRVRVLAGFRQLRLREHLGIAERTDVIDGPLVGNRILVGDSFETTNNFYGGQVGLAIDVHVRRFLVEMYAKAAVGDLEQNVIVDGRTLYLGQNIPGGLLATSSNIGSHTRNRFGVVPEAGANLGLPIGDHLMLSFGYSFLYFGKVVRPGPQVDLGVNPNLVPTSTTFGTPGGPNRPTVSQSESNFWAHLCNVAITVKY